MLFSHVAFVTQPARPELDYKARRRRPCFFFFPVLVFVFLSTSEVQDLGLGCFAGGSACREQGSPLLPGSRVLHFAELFENRFFFACRSLRIRGTGRALWQDSRDITFDSAQYPFRCISEESAQLLASWLLGFLDAQ